MKTCARHGVPNTMTTDDPGVWIGERVSAGEESTESIQEARRGDTGLSATTRKICAVGVHITRGVTTHGIGLNVFDASIVDPENQRGRASTSRDAQISRSGEGYLSWGFDRITACGLEGKTVTWLSREGAPTATTLESVAQTLQEEVCLGLSQMGKVGIDGVDVLNQEELLAERDAYSAETVD